MSIGFDLTQFGVRPGQQPPRPVSNEPVALPTPQPTPVNDPSAPQNMSEALTKPLNTNLQNEDGTDFEDKLARKAPSLKKSLWGIDKFASDVRPIQVKGKNGKMIWIDGNGNNILDPDTGEILTKPPSATDEDRQDINFHDVSNGDTLNEIK